MSKNSGRFAVPGIKRDAIESILSSLECDEEHTPANNPKHAAGRAKASFRSIPPVALAYLGAVHQSGADRYGSFNWGEAGVTASVYYDAILRHLLAWYAGEWEDPDSGLPHLAHIMAGCAIVIDCFELGNLEDDRPVGRTSLVKPVLDALSVKKV